MTGVHFGLNRVPSLFGSLFINLLGVRVSGVVVGGVLSHCVLHSLDLVRERNHFVQSGEGTAHQRPVLVFQFVHSLLLLFQLLLKIETTPTFLLINCTPCIHDLKLSLRRNQTVGIETLVRLNIFFPFIFTDTHTLHGRKRTEEHRRANFYLTSGKTTFKTDLNNTSHFDLIPVIN